MSEKLTKGLKELVKREAGKAAKKEEKLEFKAIKKAEKSTGRADGGADKWIKSAVTLKNFKRKT